MKFLGSKPVAPFAALIVSAALALLFGTSSLLAQSAPNDPLPTVEEAAAELVGLTEKLTPFSFRYVPEAKLMIYREIIESTDKAQNNRIGELHVRVDRIDPTRINYSPGTSNMGTLAIGGRNIAGGILFFCKPDQKCLRRGFPDPQTGQLAGEESGEDHYVLDIVEGVILNDLRLYAGLVQILAGHDPR